MQTFLPYENFRKSAKCLDRARLGKQRVECLQLLHANTKASKGWFNHPCAKMWWEYPFYLCTYGIVICQEWRSRGYADTCLGKIAEIYHRPEVQKSKYHYPKWLGNVKFHQSHQSNLLRKDYDHYSQFGWDVPNNLEYVWPQQSGPYNVKDF